MKFATEQFGLLRQPLPDLDFKDWSLPLSLAVMRRCLPVVKLLLSFGVSCDAVSPLSYKTSSAPIVVAMEMECYDIVDMFIADAHGPEYLARTVADRVLRMACKANRRDIVEQFADARICLSCSGLSKLDSLPQLDRSLVDMVRPGRKLPAEQISLSARGQVVGHCLLAKYNLLDMVVRGAAPYTLLLSGEPTTSPRTVSDYWIGELSLQKDLRHKWASAPLHNSTFTGDYQEGPGTLVKATVLVTPHPPPTTPSPPRLGRRLRNKQFGL